MKRIIHQILLLWILVPLFSLAQNSNNFTREAVLADLDYLYDALRQTHIAPFAYVSAQELEAAYQQTRTAITQDSLNVLEATKLLQPFAAQLKNGHTEVVFPIPQYIEYASQGGKLFPLEAIFHQGDYKVTANWSEDKRIQPGTKLLSINGEPIQDVFEKLYRQLAGERPYYIQTKAEFFTLPRLYWQVYGPQESFQVGVELSGSVQELELSAVAALDDFEYIRTDAVNAEMNLEFTANAAVLNPGSFKDDLNLYKAFIDSSFVEIKKRNLPNLIIDLRGNGGGDDSFADYLTSYIADKPFKWCSEFKLRSSRQLKDALAANRDTTSAYQNAIFSKANGEVFSYDFPKYEPKPASRRYQGEVYVLVNRHSYSQAAVTAAQLKDYGWATIVGEETAEYPSLYASVFNFSLPNTGIPVVVSKGEIVRVSGDRSARGVLPDIEIANNPFDSEDQQLKKLLQILKQPLD
ncbi:S41 family peptidase [Gilvibacter sediminis]|uniref:S41 family peptidase n=1 Tax=Gilvibacter sediminis TaxID=379071 RepID=UPI0023502559|nr:S41 family peptidase [Gilvibacter sediminis]MDC7996534.1 S41 family peptidase [Gilvibacter sediminis]